MENFILKYSRLKFRCNLSFIITQGSVKTSFHFIIFDTSTSFHKNIRIKKGIQQKEVREDGILPFLLVLCSAMTIDGGRIIFVEWSFQKPWTLSCSALARPALVSHWQMFSLWSPCSWSTSPYSGCSTTVPLHANS